MRKCIKEINNYIANNPFIHNEPLKHRLMLVMFLIYKKIRIIISRWYPLAVWQKSLWSSNDNMLFDRQPTNAAVVCINRSEQPFFNIEYLYIMELIPKEQIDDVILGIKKFRAKHGRGYIVGTNKSNAEYFKGFYSGQAFSHLGSFSVKRDSKLRKYVSQIHFRVINLSNSFCCLNIGVFLDERLKQDLSSYVVSHVPNQKMIAGYDGKKWYKFRTLGWHILPGYRYKYKTLEMVITDIKWNVLNELSKSITKMIFQSQKINAPCICSILTNIDGNANKEFWKSVNIDPRLCDFCNDMSACIAWRNKDNSPFFLYSNVKKNDATGVYNDILAYDIGDELCSYMIASCIDISIRRKLAKYSFDISKLKNKSVRYWLQSKIKFDMDVFYEARFVSEYKYNIGENNFQDFSRLIPNKKPVIFQLYSNIESRIKDTKNFYNSIVNLYQSNIDYRNFKANYIVQCIALISSIVSTIVAIVAIVISIMSSESAIKTIISWWICLKNIFK